jgi:hypothetical protein
MMLPAISRFWSFAISCMYLRGIGARALGDATEFFWRQQVGSCRANGGGASRYHPRRCFAGTAISSDASGHTEASGSPVDRESQIKW